MSSFRTLQDARLIAREVVDGTMDPVLGCELIAGICERLYEPPELVPFMDLARHAKENGQQGPVRDPVLQDILAACRRLAAEAPGTPSRRLKKVFSVLAEGIAGALLASIARGIYLGVEQLDAGFGWLSIPISAVVTPAMIFVDLLMLATPLGFSQMVVLPWALLGFAIGVVVGYLYERSPV